MYVSGASQTTHQFSLNQAAFDSDKIDIDSPQAVRYGSLLFDSNLNHQKKKSKIVFRNPLLLFLPWIFIIIHGLLLHILLPPLVS